MKDRWLHNLKKKMDGHKEVPPENLWDDIEQELFNKKEAKIIPLITPQEPVKKRRVGRIGSKKRKQVARIAASAVIFIAIGFSFYTNNKQTKTIETSITDYKITSDEVHNQKEEEHLFQESSEPPIRKKSEEKNNSATVFNGQGNAGNSSSIISNSSSVLGKPDELLLIKNKHETLIVYVKEDTLSEILFQKKEVTVARDSVILQEKLDKINDKITIDITDKDQWVVVDSKKSETSRKHWGLGVLSGQFSSNSTQKVNGYAMMNGAPMDASIDFEPNSAEDPLTNIIVGNQEKEVQTTIRHKTPVRMGVSFYYSLGGKWGVSTGVSYTKLSSELGSGSASYRFNSKQQLHYIGVPLQFNYEIWTKGRFSAYMNAGILIEKAVSGTLKTDYIVDSSLLETTRERIKSKTLQTSLNTGVGISYRLTDNAGVYFEPGLRYHFDDKSAVYTIYKDKPLNFNVQFGLRLNIGK